MVRKLRVVFLDGPGDAIESFRFWEQGTDNPNVTHIAFSQQFFDACRSVDATVLVIAEHARLERVSGGRFTVEHWGDPTVGKSGIGYHLAVVRRAAKLFREIIRFRADVVVSTDRPYPFLLHVLRLFRIKTIINFHCVLWCMNEVPLGVRRLLNQLNGTFLRSGCTAIACVSSEVKKQVRKISAPSTVPFVDFLPWLRARTFEGISPPDIEQKPTRVLFVGRIEESKGVFDLLAVARQLRDQGRTDIVFEVCGNGSEFSRLRQETELHRLSDTFVLHGHCSRVQMREAFGRSHMVVVPTRTSFNEGFNMVIAEALLAQRPVISSRVCPAVDYASGSIFLVTPDDGEAYGEAIVHLSDNKEAYVDLQSRSYAAGERFLEESTSYRSAFEHMLGCLSRDEQITSREINPEFPSHSGRSA